MNDKVDIIIPWVDGNDQEWITEKLRIEEKYNIINAGKFQYKITRTGIIFSIYFGQ